MRKILFYLLILLSPSICFADGHLTEDQKKKTIECDNFIYKLIPNSKSEIDKLVKSGIY